MEHSLRACRRSFTTVRLPKLEAVTFLNNAYQKEIDALEKIRMDAEEKKLTGLAKKKDHALSWYRHKVQMINQYRRASCRRNSTSTQFSMMQSVHLKLPTRPSVQTLRSMSDVFSD
jgi:PleD family two-component response regulator